jgi:hypothetical protein
MAPIGPLRDCLAIVVVHTAFLVSSSFFQIRLFSTIVSRRVLGSFLKHLTLLSCFRLARILDKLSTTLCEKNYLLISMRTVILAIIS